MTRAHKFQWYWLLILAGLALALPGAVQLGTHANERHGSQANEVRSLFTQGSGCPGNVAEMYSKQRDTWMYVCFLKDSKQVGLWVLTDRVTRAWREITAFFPRNPLTYLPTVIVRDGYQLISGEVPEYLIQFFK